MSSLAALRRALTTKGFTALPVCVRCHRETQPRHWGTGSECMECEAAVRFADDRIQQIDRRLAEIWGASREGFATPADEDEAWQLECERHDLHVTLHPESIEESPDGQPVLPERHPPMLAQDDGPFLPSDGV